MNNQENIVISYAQMLQDGLNEVFSSEPYRRFLTFIANNPNYSYRNALLILQQCPHATKVKGFHAWKKVGRVANQRGLRINAHFFKEDDDQTLIKKIAKKNKKNTFRRISVFDISQTIIIDEDVAYENGFGEAEITQANASLPFQTDMLMGEVEEYDYIIRTIQILSPIPIYFRTSLTDGSCGDSDIVIKKGMSQLHTIRTMLNQIARYWCKSFCVDNEQLEIVAESITFIVCQYLGLDTSEYSFNHIAKYSLGKEQKYLENFLDNIQKNALYLIDGIDGIRESERIDYDISEYFILINQKTVKRLFQNNSPIYLVFPGEGELLAMKKKDVEDHIGPFATDRSVWFDTNRMAA